MNHGEKIYVTEIFKKSFDGPFKIISYFLNNILRIKMEIFFIHMLLFVMYTYQQELKN